MSGQTTITHKFPIGVSIFHRRRLTSELLILGVGIDIHGCVTYYVSAHNPGQAGVTRHVLGEEELAGYEIVEERAI